MSIPLRTGLTLKACACGAHYVLIDKVTNGEAESLGFIKLKTRHVICCLGCSEQTNDCTTQVEAAVAWNTLCSKQTQPKVAMEDYRE